MVRDASGRVRLGTSEWIAALTLLVMIVAQLGTSLNWLWGMSDRVLILEKQQETTAEALDDIKQQTDLIPRIDQRVMAIEERRP